MDAEIKVHREKLNKSLLFPCPALSFSRNRFHKIQVANSFLTDFKDSEAGSLLWRWSPERTSNWCEIVWKKKKGERECISSKGTLCAVGCSPIGELGWGVELNVCLGVSQARDRK